jgi:hypothetical protein
LVIIDVLSDIEGFLNTDMTTPAKIIKKIHDAARGDEMDEVPPCAILCVAHTKGGDGESLKADAIRGGSVIRQEATCILGISEEEQGDLTNNVRVVTLLKRPRNRDYTGEPVRIVYDKNSHRYTSFENVTDGIPIQPRKKLPPNVPKTNTPSEHTTTVGTETKASTVPTTTGDVTTTPSTPAKQASESVSSGLPMPTHSGTIRDEGDTTNSRPNEVTASSVDEPTVPVESSSPVNQGEQRTQAVTTPPEQSGDDKRLTVLRAMYTNNPDILERHRTKAYKTNNAIRKQLTELGYELL